MDMALASHSSLWRHLLRAPDHRTFASVCRECARVPEQTDAASDTVTFTVLCEAGLAVRHRESRKTLAVRIERCQARQAAEVQASHQCKGLVAAGHHAPVGHQNSRQAIVAAWNIQRILAADFSGVFRGECHRITLVLQLPGTMAATCGIQDPAARVLVLVGLIVRKGSDAVRIKGCAADGRRGTGLGYICQP